MSSIYTEVLDSLKQNQPVTIETRIFSDRGDTASLSRSLVSVEPLPDAQGHPIAKVTTERSEDFTIIREPVFPQERLIVLGGGHVALPVCEFAARCGFQVHVVDDRPDFACRERFPLAAQVICADFVETVKDLKITPYDYVVIITRGHSHDADCLRAVLSGTFPKYLGMIGSRRRVGAQMKLLKEEGFDEEKLNRVCTPIGLNIGAVLPSEIAVSILAELIAYKRLPEHMDSGSCCVDSDLELSVLEHLARDRNPKAVVTLIEAKGSSPRGAGAKMAVNARGQIVGTIGGGLSEASAIREAVKIIGTGRYRVMEFDMSGKVAENDGMVCGGKVRMLIEDFTN